MKVVILAGGYGTRISEESHLKPKPMIEIDAAPILWHIMKSYSYYGFNEFIICLGYKGDVVKEYFANYSLHRSDITYDFISGNTIIHDLAVDPWKVTLIDTKLDTMTGGRLKRVREHLNNETFMLTYGDGLCDIDLKALLEFHRAHGKIATVTAVQPSGRFGSMAINNESVITGFKEKQKGDGAWINGGFFVFEPAIMDYLEGDHTVLEGAPLEKLSVAGELMAFCHSGFWQCMDTLRDKNLLMQLVAENRAPWMKWR